MIKLVLVDFDDTLVLTEEACFIIENDIAEALGHPKMSRQLHIDTWGKPLEAAVIDRFPGLSPETFMEMHKKVLPDYINKGLLDGIPEANLQTLAEIRAQGKKVGILTSRDTHEVEHLIQDSHHLSEYIDAFYHAGNLDTVKPDPRVFDQPLKDFGVAASEAIYIGDSINDGLCAKQAGLHFIADLESGLRTPEDFDHITVDAFVYSFPEIKNYITSH